MTNIHIEDIVIAFVVGCAAMWLMMTGAKSHSWYDAECCSSQDCEMLDADQVRIEGDFYVLPGGHRVRIDKARRSRDRDFHWCRTLGTPRTFIEPQDKLQCFYAPQGDM